jgi:acetyl-CoA C-acetyltransferase
LDEAVILSACRTPIGSFGGVFKDLSAADLGAIVIREAIARAEVDPKDLGDVIMGCVLQAGAGMNVARQAAIKAGVPFDVPAETVNRVCGSGLQAVVHAVEAVKAGFIDVVLAGGTESMSNAPYLLRGARWGYRMGNGEVVDSMLLEGLTCSINGCHMGMTAEEIVRRSGVSRVDQDAFSAESQRRAEQAIGSGVFDREIVPVEVAQRKGPPLTVAKDEYPKPGTDADKLAALRPAFVKDGSVTAGNSSGINDGAAALVIATGKKAAQLGRKPLARILAYCTVGVDPMIMGMGPVEAMRKAVKRGPRPHRAQRSLRRAIAGRGPRVGARSREGERPRRRDRAGAPHRRKRRARADDPGACAAEARRRARRGIALHRRRHGHRHDRGGTVRITNPRILESLNP